MPEPPSFIEPMLCKLVASAPASAGWLHEAKFDGYRLQARIWRGEVRLRTRSGLDWTQKFPALTQDLKACGSGILDGELCAIDAAGKPDFAALLLALSARRTDELIYYAFDAPWSGVQDLRKRPLLDRKATLRGMIAPASSRIAFSHHHDSDGPALLKAACQNGLEGIVSKRADSTYRSGRGDGWVKAKCHLGMDVVVGGWTMQRDTFSSLILGAYDDKGLTYIGKVRTGFSGAVLAQLLARLANLETKSSPFTGRQPRSGAQLHWAKPELVAEVAFAVWTSDQLLRQASFRGLRQDRPPAAVHLRT